MSPTFITFYIVGWIFGLTGASLVILSLVELVAPWVHQKCAPTISILTYTLIATSLIILFAWAWEATIALTSNPYERYLFIRNRLAGPYGWDYWLRLTCTVIPQLFWIKPIRIQPLSRLIIAAITLLPEPVEHLVIWITPTHGSFPWH